jgi:hypothetical protein
MIWHDNKSVEDDVWIVVWQIVPYFPNYATAFVQLHYTLRDCAKKKMLVLGANRNEVNPRSIVIVFQTGGLPAVFTVIASHVRSLCSLMGYAGRV